MINFQCNFEFDKLSGVQYLKYQPHTSLKEFIDSYWVLKTDINFVKMSLLADAATDLFINLGTTKSNINTHMNVNPGMLYIGGPTTSAHFFNCFSGSFFIGIRFKPGGLPVFYNVSLSAIVERIGEFYDKQLSSILGIDDLFPSRLDEYFFSRKKAIYPTTTITNVIYNSKGRISVGSLAKTINLSSRTLQRYFVTNMGIGPKEFINIVRFQQTLIVLEKGYLRGDFAKIAVEMGYYDQSHFIKEIKKRGGALPSDISPIDIVL